MQFACRMVTILPHIILWSFLIGLLSILYYLDWCFICVNYMVAINELMKFDHKLRRGNYQLFL